MTPNEFKIMERKRIELEKGYYLTPERVAIPLRTSHKVTSVLVTATCPQLSFAECKYVLELARQALYMACEEDKEKSPSGGDLTGLQR